MTPCPSTDLALMPFQSVYQCPCGEGIHQQCAVIRCYQEKCIVLGQVHTANRACYTSLDHINHSHILDVPLQDTLIC